MSALIINPSPRKRKSKSKRKATTAKRKVARRRNPARRKTGMLETQVLPALYAGAGAVGANLAFDYIAEFLPAEVKTGNMRYLAEGGVILGLGMVLEQTKLIKDKKLRDNIIGGALTVTSYRALEGLAKNSGLLPVASGGVAGYQSLGLNGYENLSGMGYMSTGGPIMRKRG